MATGASGAGDVPKVGWTGTRRVGQAPGGQIEALEVLPEPMIEPSETLLAEMMSPCRPVDWQLIPAVRISPIEPAERRVAPSVKCGGLAR